MHDVSEIGRKLCGSPNDLSFLRMGQIIAVLQDDGKYPCFQVLLINAKRTSLPFPPRFFRSSFFMLSDPGTLLFFHLFSSVLRSARLNGVSNATCLCRGAGLFFLAALHRWLSSVSLLSCLLTFAKYLLNSSAFLLSKTISFPSWIRGCRLVFIDFPSRLFSNRHVLCPCFLFGRFGQVSYFSCELVVFSFVLSAWIFFSSFPSFLALFHSITYF